MNELREYSGMWLAEITDHARERIRDAATSAGLEVDIFHTGIELEYQGRDTNRFVVRLLQQVAAVLGDAEGEIECAVASDSADRHFEFYTVVKGVLVRQVARIVRGPAVVVDDLVGVWSRRLP